jgi:hypothetical protein
VRSFVKFKLHFSVPLEAHAFSLEPKFANTPADRFSVRKSGSALDWPGALLT